jgi:hypothetical protein
LRRPEDHLGHRHKREKILPYDYESAGQLLEDFWREVERIMGEK